MWLRVVFLPLGLAGQAWDLQGGGGTAPGQLSPRETALHPGLTQPRFCFLSEALPSFNPQVYDLRRALGLVHDDLGAQILYCVLSPGKDYPVPLSCPGARGKPVGWGRAPLLGLPVCLSCKRPLATASGAVLPTEVDSSASFFLLISSLLFRFLLFPGELTSACQFL